MSFAEKFIAAAISEKSALTFLDHGNLEHLFEGHDLATYKWVKEHATKYGSMPSEETFLKHTKEAALVHTDEPSGYYLNLLKSSFIEKRLYKVQGDIMKLMDQQPVDDLRGEKAFKMLQDFVMGISIQHSSNAATDFRDSWENLIRAYKKKQNKDNELFVRLGWDSFDEKSGGLDRGDVVSVCGRPGEGKTALLLYSALHGWLKHGKESPDHGRLFVSMEMSTLLIEQRMAAIAAGISASKLKHANLDSLDFPQHLSSFSKFESKMHELKTWASRFDIVDGNLAASVGDIKLRALAMPVKPSAIFIDGAYLLKHATERDRYRKVAENADLIKKELSPIAPVICSWQLSREAKKLKEGEVLGLEHIAHADAIGQISSVVLGLFGEQTKEAADANKSKLACAFQNKGLTTNPKMKSLPYKRVDILKGRSGEKGSFQVHWNWDTSDFSEYKVEDVEALQLS